MYCDGKLMTREEWQNSPNFFKLRFLNNIAAGIQYKTQEIKDVIELIIAENPEIIASDKLTLVVDQSRIVSMDAMKLWERCRALVNTLEPSDYLDIHKRCGNKKVNGKCTLCDKTVKE